MQKESLQNQIAAASKRKKADLVLKGGMVVDVFNITTFQADVAICDGMIIGVGDYEGEKEIELNGKYIAPSFIDGHVHIESAMVPPEEFSKVVLPHGVTTVIADPHEIANVGGLPAVQYMVEASKGLPLDVKMMAPSSVPATPFEHNGADLSAKEVSQLIRNGEVHGLAEVMDYPAVLKGEEEMVKKLLAAHENECVIDGHAAGLDETALNTYLTAGIRNDHEAVSSEEAKQRIKRGMYVLMREGTAAKDMEALIGSVTPYNARRFVFATDDKHLDELVEDGSIDASVRKAIKLGMDPIQALQMASLNAAECFGLKTKGAIAPGYEASFIVLSDLKNITIEAVYVKGEKVVEEGQLISEVRDSLQPPEVLLSSVRMKKWGSDALKLRLGSTKAKIIGVELGSIVTKSLCEEVTVEGGLFKPSIEKNQLKLVVAERHHELGHFGVGIVKGISLKQGAIATSISHDSHNIIACGVDDESLAQAIKELERIQGGLVVVSKGKVLAALPLELGGLMSIAPHEVVMKQLKQIDRGLVELGYSGESNPFLTLSFLALPVIPSLKLTDTGLFDVTTFSHISPEGESVSL
ncbi:adenine deaminase [Alkalihalophilus lindianensis]|uniref:Adenine deaminase n=1 Tax=Alkalihalophilus lindianensis TaxID=1630542 RepID=A0ABU3XCS6_9BACI|nr:adenine deaminase [Alkalihalophilus lindianensis]MDV2685687.1 adenine deaminase [Alkalihalophilus lindianensis]